MQSFPLHLPRVVSLVLLASPVLAQDLPEGFVRSLRCPDGGYLPQVAVEDGVLHLVYARGDESAADLYYVHSEDEGATFSQPLRVNAGAPADTIGGMGGARVAAGGRETFHVAWCGAPVDGVRPLYYARLEPEGDEFGPVRELAGERGGLDAAPTILSWGPIVHLAWHAPGETPAESDEREPGRHVYYRRSPNRGEHFQETRVIDDWNAGVSEGCSIASTATKRGDYYVFYRTRDGRQRDLSVLRSEDKGDRFEPHTTIEYRKARTPRTPHSATFSRRGPLFAYEEEGRVLWGVIDRDGSLRRPPIAPRRTDYPRTRPSALANDREAVVIAWIESVGAGENSNRRVQWQGFDIDQRNPIGLGRFDDEPSPATWPTIFVRPSDGGFTVVY